MGAHLQDSTHPILMKVAYLWQRCLHDGNTIPSVGKCLFPRTAQESISGTHKKFARMADGNMDTFLEERSEHENFTESELNDKIVVRNVQSPRISKHGTGRIREVFEDHTSRRVDRGLSLTSATPLKKCWLALK